MTSQFALNHFMVRLIAYLLRLFRKRLKLPLKNLKNLAVEKVVICEAEEGVLSPSITLRDQIRKATGTFSGNLSDAINYATLTQFAHSATVMYRIENVILDSGYLYKDLHAEYVSTLGFPTRKTPQFIDSMCLCSSPSGSRFFGDWLISDNLLELLARELGMEPLKIRPHMNYSHLPALNKLLNLSDKYCDDVLHIKNLYIFEDAGYNKSKTKRLQILRQNIRNNIKALENSAKLVYIGRGAGYQLNRGLVNEAEVIEYLKSIGFIVIDPSQHSAPEILQNMMDCSVVIGVEGSQLSYGFLSLKQGGLMMVLQPPYRFQSSFRPRCAAVGIDWGFLVGLEKGNGFQIDVSEIEEVLSPYVSLARH